MALPLPDGRRGQALALALCGLALALVWFVAAVPLIGLYTNRAAEITQRATLALRMQAIAENLPALRRQAEAAPHENTSLLTGQDDAVAGAALQERIQRLAEAVHVGLASIEMLPPTTTGGYRRIALRLSISAGRWDPVMHLLQAIETGPPRMLVDDLQIRGLPIQNRTLGAPVDATFSVTAYRLAGPTTIADGG